MKWRGEYIINGVLYRNEVLPTGLSFLGGVLSGGVTDFFGHMRLEDGDNNEIATNSLSTVTFTVEPDTLTVESVCEFAAGEMVAQAEYAVLISELGIDIARAPILASYNQAVIITRRDIFEVNAP